MQIVSAANISETAAVSTLTETPLPYRQIVFNADKPGDFNLVLFLHGAGERGNDNEKQKIHAVARICRYIAAHEFKTVMLIPQCPEKKQWVDTPWSGTSHTIKDTPSLPIQAVFALIDAKINEFAVNPEQIRVCGISMGGYGTWDVISRRPEMFTAAFPVCGGADEAMAARLAKMNITTCHGALDSIVPVCRSRNMVKALQDAGNNDVMYTELPEGKHFVWETAFNDQKSMDKFFRTLLEK